MVIPRVVCLPFLRVVAVLAEVVAVELAAVIPVLVFILEAPVELAVPVERLVVLLEKGEFLTPIEPVERGAWALPPPTMSNPKTAVATSRSGRNTPAPKAIERVFNAVAESAQSAAGVVSGAGRFALGRVLPYQGLHNLVREFYRRLAEGLPMPVTVESARSIVEWTERVARRADVAKSTVRLSRPGPTQPAVSVTGANGLLGRVLVRRLLERGERVRLFVRREPPPEIHEHPLVDVVVGDLGNPSAVAQGLENATTVFHCGAAMFGLLPGLRSQGARLRQFPLRAAQCGASRHGGVGVVPARGESRGARRL